MYYVCNEIDLVITSTFFSFIEYQYRNRPNETSKIVTVTDLQIGNLTFQRNFENELDLHIFLESEA